MKNMKLITLLMLAAILVFIYISMQGFVLRPFLTTNRYLVEKLGIAENGWQSWAIDKLIQKGKENEQMVNMLQSATMDDNIFRKSGAHYILFRIGIDSRSNLNELILLCEESETSNAINLLMQRLGEEDKEYADIIVPLFKYRDLRSSFARICLLKMGYSEMEIEQLESDMVVIDHLE